MKRISYGLALPGLYVTVTIYLHVSIFIQVGDVY
jgi:hypothetical protein